MLSRLTLLLALALAPLQASFAQALEPKPKLAAGAVPLGKPDGFVRSNPAPDFWSLMPFYVPQSTDAACSVASIAIALNAIRGLPALASDPLITQQKLLEKVADERWAVAVDQGGFGVTWAELEQHLRNSLKAYQVPATIEVWRPSDASGTTLRQLRTLLAENEQSSADILIAVFDQGVLTGDVNIGHVSPIGAYDEQTKRVLVMDTDREWHVPYWVSDELFLDAMLKPGPQDVERGGLLRVRRMEPQVN